MPRFEQTSSKRKRGKKLPRLDKQTNLVRQGGSTGTDSNKLPGAVNIVKIGDEVWVKCLEIDDKGRVKLSRKAAMEQRDKEMEAKDGGEGDSKAEDSKADDSKEEASEE